jgi:uncharacterized membrane protein SirB2
MAAALGLFVLLDFRLFFRIRVIIITIFFANFFEFIAKFRLFIFRLSFLNVRSRGLLPSRFLPCLLLSSRRYLLARFPLFDDTALVFITLLVGLIFFFFGRRIRGLLFHLVFVSLVLGGTWLLTKTDCVFNAGPIPWVLDDLLGFVAFLVGGVILLDSLLQHEGVPDWIVFVLLFHLALKDSGGFVHLFKLFLILLSSLLMGKSVFLVQSVNRFAVFNCLEMVLVRGPLLKENIGGLSLGEALLMLDY